jgi:hypothetical protein
LRQPSSAVEPSRGRRARTPPHIVDHTSNNSPHTAPSHMP